MKAGDFTLGSVGAVSEYAAIMTSERRGWWFRTRQRGYIGLRGPGIVHPTVCVIERPEW